MKVSIVIPVHNGAKFIRKTVKHLQKQTYKNIEIILVENFSSDKSLKVCTELAEKYENVITETCTLKGTSQARKKGSLLSSGKYILFLDQDDRYINKYAIRNMVQAIIEDKTQVVQFGHYARRFKFLLKRKPVIDSNRIFTKEEMRNHYLGGVIGISDCYFNTAVWNKIFDAELVKSSVVNITQELYFAEDAFLNFNVLINDNLVSASCRTDCYYTWTYGVGFSSSENGNIALMKDYNIIKPIINKKITEIQMNENDVFKFNAESIYFYRAIILNEIKNRKSKETIINTIEWMNSLEYINEAKLYFKNFQDKSKIWKGLDFLVNEENSEAIYNEILSSK